MNLVHVHLNLMYLTVSNFFLHVFISSISLVILLSRLDLAGNVVVELSANHLQKLHFSFQLTTPHGHAFKPHQVCSSCLRSSR